MNVLSREVSGRMNEGHQKPQIERLFFFLGCQTSYLQVVVGCRHVVGVLEKLSHVGDNGLLIGGLDVNICSAESRQKDLKITIRTNSRTSSPASSLALATKLRLKTATAMHSGSWWFSSAFILLDHLNIFFAKCAFENMPAHT